MLIVAVVAVFFQGQMHDIVSKWVGLQGCNN